jgi:hypothetical protein
MTTKTLMNREEYLRTSFEGPEPDYSDGELLERSEPDFFHGASKSGSLMRSNLGRIGVNCSELQTHLLHLAAQSECNSLIRDKGKASNSIS